MKLVCCCLLLCVHSTASVQQHNHTFIHTKFQAWLIANGVSMPRLSFARFGGFGTGLVAIRELPAGATVLRGPPGSGSADVLDCLTVALCINVNVVSPCYLSFKLVCEPAVCCLAAGLIISPSTFLASPAAASMRTAGIVLEDIAGGPSATMLATTKPASPAVLGALKVLSLPLYCASPASASHCR